MPPSANFRLRCDAHLFGSKARALLQPGGRTHTDGDGQPAETAARVASRAGSLLCHPAPSPCLTSCMPRKVRLAVWRTHTHSGLPRARGRVGEAASTAATARARHALFFASRHPYAMPTHTRPSQLHMAHPAQHMTATETHATPRQPRRPHRARPAHPGTLRPCIDSHPLPAHGSNAPYRVGSAPQRAQRELCTASTNQPSSLQRTAEHRARRSPRPM